jgi:hypothetical protein
MLPKTPDAPPIVPQHGKEGVPSGEGDGSTGIGSSVVTRGISQGLGSGGIGGAAAGGAEAISGLLSLFCWAAAIYFPRDSQDWQDARDWIASGWDDDPVGLAFRDWYVDNGEALASRLEEDELFRVVLYPFFEWCRSEGSKKRRELQVAGEAA